MARRKFSEKQKRSFLAKFEAWDGSAAAFCRKHRLSYQTLRAWRLRAARPAEPAKPLEFVEVEVVADRSGVMPGSAPPVAEIELGAGVVLRVFPVPGRSS